MLQYLPGHRCLPEFAPRREERRNADFRATLWSLSSYLHRFVFIPSTFFHFTVQVYLSQYLSSEISLFLWICCLHI
jgi:hypothetical protein